MSFSENVKSNTGIKVINALAASEIFWVSVFAFLTVLAAQVSVPVPPVPFTLQTMLVVLSGAFLGARNGALSQIFYIGLGVMGLPVFANFSSIQSLFGPTAGYLIAFPAGAFIAGFITERAKSFPAVFAAMALGNLIILMTGSAYLSLFFHKSFGSSLFAGAFIFGIWDIIKISAAASIYFGISKKYHRLPL